MRCDNGETVDAPVSICIIGQEKEMFVPPGACPRAVRFMAGKEGRQMFAAPQPLLRLRHCRPAQGAGQHFGLIGDRSLSRIN